MAWWQQIDDSNDPFAGIDDEDLDDEEIWKQFDEYEVDDSEQIYRDQQELANIGHHLYTQAFITTSNNIPSTDIRKKFEKTQEKYSDAQFPANSTSLVKDWTLAEFNVQRQWKTFIWKRCDEIFKTQSKIMVFNTIDPNDILQGNLGDCYFLSSLSAMAEFEHRIKRCFDTQEYQPSGCYVVHIYDMGVRTEFTLDDYFPCTQEGNVAFSGPHYQQNIAELWVLLLEKAWAKRFGSYWNIDAGFPEDVLTDFTGGPCEMVETEDVEAFWEKVFEANEQDWIITAASSGSEGCGDLINEMGLVTLHAYAVIDTKVVNGPKGQARILMIRNPWGEQEWTGEWSDADSVSWTEENKKICGWENSNDGRFWMKVEDFCKYFTSITICRVHDDYFNVGVHSSQGEGKFSVFNVTFTQETHAYFIVTQVDTRRFQGDSGYDYSPVRIIISKISGKKLKYKRGVSNAYLRDVWTDETLSAGTYAVYVQIDWVDNFTEQFGFSVYSSSSATIKDSTFENKDFLQRTFNIDLVRQLGEERNIGPEIYFYTLDYTGVDEEDNQTEGILVDAIDNRSSDKRVELTVMHKAFENVELLEPYADDSYLVNLGPGESAVIVKRQIDMLEETAISLGMRKRILQA